MTTTARASRMFQAALTYAQRLNWPVFPCHWITETGACSCGRPDCGSPGKHPLTEHGLKEATPDPDKIRRWWMQWLDANIGIPTGAASGFDVLDVDPRHSGEESLAELEAKHGKLPATVEAITGGGGRYILFRHREGISNKTSFLPGLDVRGEGGYIVVAPSTHASGRRYAWELSSRPSQIPIADWPAWLLELVKQPINGRTAGPAPAIGDIIPKGQRNATLTSLAGSIRRRGGSKGAILAALREENKVRCQPSLPDEELQKIAASVARRYAPAASPASGAGGIEEAAWPIPQPLPDALPSVEPFPVELLPQAVRGWVQDIAERMQCPIDYPAIGIMVVLAAVVGRQVAIRPRQRDDWTVVPNLWGAVVGRPGLLKSPALAEVRRPLDILEARARESHETAISDHQAQDMVAEALRKKAQQDISQALKEGKDPQEIARAAIQAEPPPPVRRRYLVHDVTVEKLGEILKGNPRGVLLFRDELTGFLKTLERDGHEADRAFFLEAWNGTGRFSYDRIGRGTIDIEAACISILGGIQPGPLSVYLSRAARGGGDDDGLVQRFQLVAWPDLPGEWREVDTPPDAQARQRAFEVFERLDHIDSAAVGAETPAEGGLPSLRFTSAAQEVFTEWRGELERRLRGEDLPPLLEAHLAKYRSLIPSLALLIHLADIGQGPVGEDAVLRACAWGEYLESHACRLYAPAISPTTTAARALAKHIRAGDLGEEFTPRIVQQKGWSGLEEREIIAEALEVLEALDWLRREEPAPLGGGRPSLRYRVNPGLCRR